MQSSYFVAPWIASWSLSSGSAEPVIGRAFARPVGADPLARNDDLKPFWLLKIELGIRVQIHVVPAKPTGPAFGRPDDRLRASRDP